MKIGILIFSFLFLIACSSDNKKYEYYSNGSIRFEFTIKNQLKNGRCLKYYENGKIASEAYFLNDTLNGPAKYYYPTGDLRESCFWKKGLIDSLRIEYYRSGVKKSIGRYSGGRPSGDFQEFDSLGKLNAIREYVIVKNSSHVNNVYVFDNNGDTVITKSNFYRITFCNDSIHIGDKFRANLNLIAPLFEKSKLVIYFVDPEDTLYYDGYPSDNYSFNYEYKPKKIGKLKMKGFIEELGLQPYSPDSAHIKSRDLYFDVDYIVY
jgi:antitoxin component YwqK of YwqJK toxin-antitoxin module